MTETRVLNGEANFTNRCEENSVPLEVSDNGPGYSKLAGAQLDTGICIKLNIDIHENELPGMMELPMKMERKRIP